VTGEPERAPGLDGLPTFTVVEKNDKFFVHVPKYGLPKKVSQPLAKRDPENKKHFVIVGGGPAGLNCAETLRQSNYTGQITVLSNEGSIPYDRTLLSKALPVGDASKWTLRPSDYLQDADIDYKLNSQVKSVNAKSHEIVLTSGEKVKYDKLCIATGSSVNKPKVKGLDLKGVHFLRTNKDQEAIKALAADAKSIVIVGASFIGTECASSLASKFKGEREVHLVSSGDVPFEKQLGREIGEMMMKEHVDNGVKLVRSARLNQVIGKKGQVSSVKLSNGQSIDADLVILGCGVSPNTTFLKGSGVTLQKDGGIECNPFL
jgi:apoptosis-inducing factor 3